MAVCYRGIVVDVIAATLHPSLFAKVGLACETKQEVRCASTYVLPSKMACMTYNAMQFVYGCILRLSLVTPYKYTKKIGVAQCVVQ